MAVIPIYGCLPCKDCDVCFNCAYCQHVRRRYLVRVEGIADPLGGDGLCIVGEPPGPDCDPDSVVGTYPCGDFNGDWILSCLGACCWSGGTGQSEYMSLGECFEPTFGCCGAGISVNACLRVFNVSGSYLYWEVQIEDVALPPCAAGAVWYNSAPFFGGLPISTIIDGVLYIDYTPFLGCHAVPPVTCYLQGFPLTNLENFCNTIPATVLILAA